MKKILILFAALCALLIGCTNDGEPVKWMTQATTMSDFMLELDGLEDLNYSVFYSDTVRHIYYLDVEHSNREKFAIFAFINNDASFKADGNWNEGRKPFLEFYKIPYGGLLGKPTLLKFNYKYGNRNLPDDIYVLDRSSNNDSYSIKLERNGVKVFIFRHCLNDSADCKKSEVFEDSSVGSEH